MTGFIYYYGNFLFKLNLTTYREKIMSLKVAVYLKIMKIREIPCFSILLYLFYSLLNASTVS